MWNAERKDVSAHLPLRMVSDPKPGVHSALPAPHSVLVDTFGRRHNNLRISVTDRCNLRCTYCMPEDVVFRDKSELLTFEEITHFVRVAAGLGIDKVRLTGGEPLMRRDLHELVRMVVAVPGIGSALALSRPSSSSTGSTVARRQQGQV